MGDSSSSLGDGCSEASCSAWARSCSPDSCCGLDGRGRGGMECVVSFVASKRTTEEDRLPPPPSSSLSSDRARFLTAVGPSR